MKDSKINITIGSGGKQMHEFIHNELIKKLGNETLNKLDDSAVLDSTTKKLAMTTDSYVISPLFFPGGDIGRLCICGTVNDLSCSGAKPVGLSLSFIIEEGISKDVLRKVIDSIAKTAKEANINIVTGDTKVVEKGKGDGIYINTCGVGCIDDGINLSTHNAQVGDFVYVTRGIANHEAALFACREELDLKADILSDVAPLNLQVQNLLSKTKNIHTIKDPTRGGLASSLHEIVDHSNVQILLNEEDIPVQPSVKALCDLVGFDPLYMANEGTFIIIAPESEDKHIRSAFQKAVKIGAVVGKKKELNMKTAIGGLRRIGMLETTQLPRIC